MLVLTIKDGDSFYIDDLRVRVLIDEYYVDGGLELMAGFGIASEDLALTFCRDSTQETSV